MLAAAEALQRSMPLWSLLSVVNTLLVIAGCAMLTGWLFRMSVRRHPLPWIVCGALDFFLHPIPLTLHLRRIASPRQIPL